MTNTQQTQNISPPEANTRVNCSGRVQTNSNTDTSTTRANLTTKTSTTRANHTTKTSLTVNNKRTPQDVDDIESDNERNDVFDLAILHPQNTKLTSSFRRRTRQVNTQRPTQDVGDTESDSDHSDIFLPQPAELDQSDDHNDDGAKTSKQHQPPVKKCPQRQTQLKQSQHVTSSTTNLTSTFPALIDVCLPAGINLELPMLSNYKSLVIKWPTARIAKLEQDQKQAGADGYQLWMSYSNFVEKEYSESYFDFKNDVLPRASQGDSPAQCNKIVGDKCTSLPDIEQLVFSPSIVYTLSGLPPPKMLKPLNMSPDEHDELQTLYDETVSTPKVTRVYASISQGIPQGQSLADHN
ncbi:uncharacterized protein MELLADRAFT_60357 [Melampsora larici-populina 98AG31]|uniref:Uncharacterized protein n=1 Tax=Melampsora larici-populina (strain 98AG31 / pathotype 3-4-7) TaxID=747676 RepID=F4R9T1_MELLP|nr:uncharacterized protein MELLADRAFT_60357 [Melampsora larici-populina 98AG31]EGG10679.1 hypothetical protein MELLADRAFT_60357 [Melampsora larici-populina 98AG31]